MKTIERILIQAEKQGIKQADIAKALGKGTSHITNWKNRNTDPPIEHIPTIAKLLNVSIEWLITGEDSKQENFPKEQQLLLDYFNQCNQEGKNRIIEQAEFIATKYPKERILSECKIG